MDFRPSARSQDVARRVRAFLEDRVLPREGELDRARRTQAPGAEWRSWRVTSQLHKLREEARAEGLWNLFLPDAKLGAGLSTVEYAPVAEEMGRSLLAPELFNCNAPDTGNMEVLWRYGSDAQKARWLTPLLDARIRSAFCMTEPDVASSDATNVRATARVEGDEVVLDGRKWWCTGLGHPECRLLVFLGVTDPQADRYHRHSMVLVPKDAKGVRIERMLDVFGDHDGPYGHGEVTFTDVRLPKDEALVAGPGAGFEIAQGRLGPGRIHHCMRCVGAAERALELLVRRGASRVAFGKPLVNLGGNRERIAEHRIAIDQARLLTLHAAWRLDEVGPLGALADVSAIKVAAPNVLQRVVDDAIQMHGGLGLTSDVPLASMLALARVLRIADGPDEVHRGVVARAELAKYPELRRSGE
ncbi:MAG TPA: acyl-CoA dehydrogenase family protein [Candidatus Thermoplasmatota archaeon]|nr:acyl-CoA dehydrogenase family protein [Candidatus Thermoplasmatota archaeon]